MEGETKILNVLVNAATHQSKTRQVCVSQLEVNQSVGRSRKDDCISEIYIIVLLSFVTNAELEVILSDFWMCNQESQVELSNHTKPNKAKD